MVDAGKEMVEFDTGGKGWLDDLVVQLNYEPYMSCSAGATAAEPIDVWARVGSAQDGWLRWRTLGVGGMYGHPGG